MDKALEYVIGGITTIVVAAGGLRGIWSLLVKPYIATLTKEKMQDLEIEHKQKLQTLEERQKTIEVKLEKERADILSTQDMNANLKNLIAVLQTMAGDIVTTIEKLITTNTNVEQGIQKTDSKVGEVITAVSTNGNLLKELLQQLIDDIAELKIEFNQKLDAQGVKIDAQGKQLEVLLEKTEPLTPSDTAAK